MFDLSKSRLLLMATMVVVGCVLVSPSLAAEADKPASLKPLLSIGNPGPDAIKFQVWTNRPRNQYSPGDRVVIYFKADQPCHVVVANVAATGVVTVVFPNREQSDSYVQPNKEYTLFGDNSSLKLVLGKTVKQAKLVFYVSAEPVELSPLRIPEKGFVISMPATAQEQLKIFRQRIEAMAKSRGFNRQTLAIAGEGLGEADLKLMGGQFKGVIPPKSTSEDPEAIMGTQGQREDLKKE